MTSVPRNFEDPEVETGRKCWEVTEEELGAHQVLFGSRVHVQLEVECAVEGWGSFDIKAGTVVTRGVGAVWDAADLQIPKVRKLTNEIKDLFMISPWILQVQGLKGP